MTRTAVLILIVSSVLQYANAGCLCSAHGSGTSGDGKTQFDFQSTGLFQMFKSENIEVQCEFSYWQQFRQYTIVDKCRLSVKGKEGCDFTLMTGGLAGVGVDKKFSMFGGSQISGKDVLSEYKRYIPADLGLELKIRGDDVQATIKTANDGTIDIMMRPWEFSVNAPKLGICSGLCGSCNGKLERPVKVQDWGRDKVCDHTNGVKPIEVGKTCPKPDPTVNGTSPTTNLTSKPTSAPLSVNVTRPPPPTTIPAPTTAAVTPIPTTANATIAPTTAAATPAPTTANLTTAPTTAAATPAPTTANLTTAPTTVAATPAPTTAAATPAPTAANTTATPTTAAATPAPTTANATTSGSYATIPPTTNAESTTPSNTTSAPSTTVPTTAPVVTLNQTSAPPAVNSTQMPVPNATPNVTIPVPEYVPCDETKVVHNPCFESDAVLKSVINQCLCGQSEDRMETDDTFGMFVENCIYDKSLGPGAEEIAHKTMETCQRILDLEIDNVEKGLTLPTFNNKTAISLNTAGILRKTVTRSPIDIPLGTGVTYRLVRTSRPLPNVVMPSYLQPRPTVYMNAGIITQLPDDQIQVAIQPMSSTNAPSMSSTGAPSKLAMLNNFTASDDWKVRANKKIAEAFLSDKVPELAANVRAGREPEVAAMIAMGTTNHQKIGVTPQEAKKICDGASMSGKTFKW